MHPNTKDWIICAIVKTGRVSDLKLSDKIENTKPTSIEKVLVLTRWPIFHSWRALCVWQGHARPRYPLPRPTFVQAHVKSIWTRVTPDDPRGAARRGGGGAVPVQGVYAEDGWSHAAERGQGYQPGEGPASHQTGLPSLSSELKYESCHLANYLILNCFKWTNSQLKA